MPSLIRSSIRHNWRTHLGVVLGCALASLVLVGALMVGDSVKGTLRAQAEARVGKIGEALLCGERFVPWPADKAKRPAVLARMFFPGQDAAGMLLMQGSAVRSDGKARANKVQVVGVDGDFWKLSPSGLDKSDGSVALNERIAAQLSLKVGDELSLYVEKPGAFSKDAPLSGEEAALVTVKARVGRIVGDEDFGRFALTASQVPPNTVFVPLGELQAKVGLGEKVNVICEPIAGLDSERGDMLARALVPEVDNAKKWWPPRVTTSESSTRVIGSNTLFGLGSDMTLNESPGRKWLDKSGWIEIRSPRVFLDPSVVAGARKAESDSSNFVDIQEPPKVTLGRTHHTSITTWRLVLRYGPPPPGLDSLTYFVTAIEKDAASGSEPRSGGIPAAENQTRSANQGSAPPTGDQALRAKDTAAGMPPLLGSLHSQSTPYSMVTAIDAPASGFVQAELADDEIQITRWLADDLDAKPGDKLTLRYSVMGERRELIEKTRTFTVLAPIIEMEEPHLDSSWMPDFPNIPDKDSFSKWKPGFPFDSKRIRKKDEEYWEKHRGTPKAFVNLKVGQEMWGNRWGNLTSIRYYADRNSAVPPVPPEDGSWRVENPVLRDQVERIAAFIDPKALGFRVVNLREQALAATDAPVDFGQLFASFSFFLIAAAAVLTGLLFTFTIEQRSAEAGLLLSVGWTRKQVRRLFLKEGALLAIIGATVGVAGAVLYTKAVLAALAGAWSGATGGTQFLFVVNTGTIIGGILGSVLMALFAMWLASRRIFKHEAAALMSGNLADVTK